jgi:hypothetical protein
VSAQADTQSTPEGPGSGVVSNVPQYSHISSEAAIDRGPMANDYQNQSTPTSPPSVGKISPDFVAHTPEVRRGLSLLNLQPSSLLVPQPQPISTSNLTMSAALLSPSTTQTYCITLARGLKLHYDESDLQQPSSFQRLVSCPATLYSVWNDSSPSWDPKNCPLIIRGISIAIKHWRTFYRNFNRKTLRKTVWDSEIKQNWYNYKVITTFFSIPL